MLNGAFVAALKFFSYLPLFSGISFILCLCITVKIVWEDVLYTKKIHHIWNLHPFSVTLSLLLVCGSWTFHLWGVFFFFFKFNFSKFLRAELQKYKEFYVSHVTLKLLVGLILLFLHITYYSKWTFCAHASSGKKPWKSIM